MSCIIMLPSGSTTINVITTDTFITNATTWRMTISLVSQLFLVCLGKVKLINGYACIFCKYFCFVCPYLYKQAWRVSIIHPCLRQNKRVVGVRCVFCLILKPSIGFIFVLNIMNTCYITSNVFSWTVQYCSVFLIPSHEQFDLNTNTAVQVMTQWLQFRALFFQQAKPFHIRLKLPDSFQ